MYSFAVLLKSSGKTMKTLENKIAILIGASRGIGIGVAKVFIKKGATVIIVSREEKALQTTKEKLEEEFKVKVDTYSADITNQICMTGMVNYVLNKYKRIDILCQNAGIFPAVYLDEMSEDNWDHVLDTNLKGTFFAVKSVLPIMKKQKYGRIVITSSITGPKVGNPGLAHYGASKGGIEGFIKTAAIELARYNITINSVEPGNILTEALYGLGEHYIPAQERAIPMGYLGEPEDIGYAEAFLASDEAKYITGQSIVVDGGQTLPESQYDIPR